MTWLKWLLVPVLLLAGLAPARALTYYADAGRPNDSGDGLTWATAKRTLQAAIDVGGGAPHEVWAKKGTYAEAVTLKTGVALYGGFAGTETRLADRKPKANPTIIDGSHAAAGQPANHVVTMDKVSGVTLVGFTIRGGYGKYVPNVAGSGGGIYANLVDQTSLVGDCTITSNTADGYGAGLYLVQSALRVTTCMIQDNATQYGYGGGVAITSGSPILSGCTIQGNLAGYGGGIDTENANLSVDHCAIEGNMASRGGGLYSVNGSVTLSHSKVRGNNATSGGGIMTYDVKLALDACDISANKLIHYMDIFPYAGGGISMTRGSLTMCNCQLSGNSLDSGFNGNGLYLSTTPATITNCTIARNGWDYAGGIYGVWDYPIQIARSIVAENGHKGIIADSSVQDVLFFSHDVADYYHAQSPVIVNATTSETRTGDPRLGKCLAGYWTEPLSYDTNTRRTRLVTANAALTPGALAGRLISLSTTRPVQALVRANTATTIELAGDATSGYYDDTDFYLVDNRPGYGSAALDAVTTGPASDLAGNARPIDLPGLGASRTGTEFDLGADEISLVAKAQIQITAPGGLIDYGTTPLSTTPPATRQVTIRNNGFASLQFIGSGMKISGHDSAAFSLAAPPDLTPLAPGGERILTVQFKPAALVRHTALLTITTNDPVLPSITLGLQGDGVYPPPVMTPEPPYTPGTQNTVSWSAARGARGYTVQCGYLWRYYDGRTEYDVDYTADVSSTTLSHTFTNLYERSLYTYRVRSNYGAGVVSPWSAMTSSTQVADLPSVGYLQAKPAVANANETTTLTFTANRTLNNLSVTVNGHIVTFVKVIGQSPMDDQDYYYRYTLLPTDPPGYQRIAISGTDAFGKRVDFISTQTLAKPGAILVDSRAAAGGDGSTWAKALRTINQALTAAAPGMNTIWVAAGRYGETIALSPGRSLYGGFSGVETQLDQRDPQRNQTWIDVSKANAGRPAPAAVYLGGRGKILLDGFWITGACPNRCSYDAAPVYSGYTDKDCQVSHCVITGNRTADGQPCAGISLWSSSMRVTDCVIAGNAAPDGDGGGVFIYIAELDPPVFERCVITGNVGRDGGGVCCQSGKASFIDCVIANNRGESSDPFNGGRGAGLYAYHSTLTLTRTIICGNTSTGYGGGLYTRDDGVLNMDNCVISGNTAAQGSGLYFIGPGFNDWASTLVNCTFSNNASPQDGAVHVMGRSNLTFKNVIFAHPTGYDLFDEDEMSKLFFDHCLFDGGKGLYYSKIRSLSLTSVTELTRRYGGSAGDLSGTPNFLTGIDGYWSASPAYDPVTSRTTLIAAGAPFTPGALTGRVIDLRGDLHSMVAITSNTASAIQVAGDQRALAGQYAPYQFLDLHPGYGSAAIDMGTGAGVPTTDLEGVPRPIDIPGRGWNGPGLAYDIGACEAQVITGPKLVARTNGPMNFGGITPRQGTSPITTITLTNSGYASLTFNGAGVAITGAAAADFSFSATPSLTALAPGASRTLGISLKPSAWGPRLAFLTVTTNDPQHPRLDIPLTGYRSVDPPVMLKEPAMTSSTWNLVYWTQVPNAHYFTVQCSGKADFSAPVTVNHISPAYPYCKFTGLQDGQTYWYRVRACDTWDQPSAWSAPTSSTQDNTAPQAYPWLGTASPTFERAVIFNITFSEPVRPFSASDLALAGSIASPVTLKVTGSGSVWSVRAYVTDPRAWGELGLVLGGGVRDLAGNPVRRTVTPLCRLALPATLVVRPVPEGAANWKITPSNPTLTYGPGRATLKYLMPGTYTLTWIPRNGWDAGASASQAVQLLDGQTVELTKALIPRASGPARDRARVLEYLLGLNPNPTGLDFNGDGKVNIADMLWDQNR